MSKSTTDCHLLRAWALFLAVFCVLFVLPSPAAARDLPVVKPAVECVSLSETDIAAPGGPPARIVAAKVVTLPNAAPYCEVRGYVVPQVKFELRLPTQNWTQRLLYSGCGGFCGRVDFRIRAAEGCAAVDNSELAIVASDLGHDTPDGNGDAVWAAGNSQAKIDYGHRGVHVVTLTAKAIIQRFYGRAQTYAYFNGCSDGGREGMMEVQRYPEDFDGVAAGAAVIHDTENNSVYHGWIAQYLERADHKPMFASAHLTLLHQVALDACGQPKDGIIVDPSACHVDPSSVACAKVQREGCLSDEQVAAARAIYAGPVDETGRSLYFGRPIGSELAWGSPGFADMARSFIRYLSADQVIPGTATMLRYDRAAFERYNSLAPIYNATDSDISAFRHRGGKLIMWHGWSDTAVPAMSTVEYAKAVRARFGRSTDDFYRVYMLPGVGHCGGGDGEDKINVLDPLMAWVEDGKAPAALTATRKVFGRVASTRAIQPYSSPSR